MPVAAASRMAAHVTSKRSALALCTTTRPSTSLEPPKYSPTIAPIRLSVAATFNPVKKYGSALGCAGRAGSSLPTRRTSA